MVRHMSATDSDMDKSEGERSSFLPPSSNLLTRRNLGVACVVATCIIVGCVAAFTNDDDQHYVFRFSDTAGRIAREPTAEGSRLGVFVGYGQSNSDCCGSDPNPTLAHGDSIFNYHADGDGATYVYREPMLGAFCPLSCPYGKIGNALIESGLYDEVVFATAGMPGAPIALINGEDPAAPYFDYLVNTYQGMAERYGKVDGIL